MAGRTGQRNLATSRDGTLARDLLWSRPMSDDLQPDRPRERLWQRGVQQIGDEELLAIVLGTGIRAHPVGEIAAELVRSTGGVVAASRATPRELAQVAGVGTAQATRIAAAFELGRRAVEAEQRREVLVQPAQVYKFLSARLGGLAQEVFVVVGLDVRNGLLDVVEVARGALYCVEVHPREVFRPLLRMAAAGGIVIHNHPSGDPTPSPHDIALTRRLQAVGELVGITIIDHLVFGNHGYTSIAEWMGTDL